MRNVRYNLATDFTPITLAGSAGASGRLWPRWQ
jgi:hypothetical protein